MMKKVWKKMIVFGIIGLTSFSCLTFLPQSPLQIEAKAQNTYSEDASESVKSGWKKEMDGWKYSNMDGSYAQGCFAAVENKWYYFDQDGYMVKGWQKVSDDWYYFDSKGHMVTGTIEIGGSSYVFGNGGKLDKSYEK